MIRRLVVLIVMSTIACAACGSTGDRAADSTAGGGDPVGRVRLGWQVPWATQGQIVQVMKHTNVLSNNGVEATFVPFAFGAPLNEAALAGDVDVLFTADQPAATLLAHSNDFEIVARLMYNRVSVYVPPDSPVRSMGDLAGKTLALPFGAAVQREALRGIQEAGLDPTSDVTVVNLDLSEQAALVTQSENGQWDSIDALGGFDPTPAVFEARGLIRIIQETNVVAVVVMRKSMVANADLARRFLRAYAESWLYFARNTDVVNAWYKADANFEFAGDEPLRISAGVEPNASATKIDDVRLTFDDDDYDVMQQAADFLLANELIAEAVTMRDHIDTAIVEDVLPTITEADMARIRET